MTGVGEEGEKMCVFSRCFCERKECPASVHHGALASPPWIWWRQCVFSESLEIEDASVNHSEVEKKARACGTVGMSCERFLRN